MNIFKKSFIIVLICMFLYRKLSNIKYIYPYLLLFTSYREYSRSIWLEYYKIDTNIIYPEQHIAIIDHKKYSYQTLLKASNTWREPVVVRELFKNTSAVMKWSDPDYLSSIIGNIKISII